MPVYSARIRLSMLPGVSRGSNEAVMTHHFFFDDDDEANDALSYLAHRVRYGRLIWNWLADRTEPSHSVQMYRRDVTDAGVWVPLDELTFSLQPWPPPVTTALPNVPFAEATWEYAQNERSRRLAVLCFSNGLDGQYKQRTYVGPVAPCPLYGTVSVAGIDLFSTYAFNLDTGDDAPNPADEMDVWPESVHTAAAEYVAGLSEFFPNSGIPIVISWKLADWDTLGNVRPSRIRADLRSRGLRRPLGSPAYVP